MRGGTGPGGSLLAAYEGRLGDAIGRHQSAVALRAARMEAELALRARGTFLASMNHELRTPLNAITGFAGLLKEADAYGFDEEQKAAYLDHILESAELLLSHIDTIIEVADAESGGARLKRQVFDLAALIEEVSGEVDAVIDLDIEGGLPPVFADPDRVATAIGHLLRFAGYRDEGGAPVRITARDGGARQAAAGAGQWIYVAVAEIGGGRGAEEVAAALRVFERIHEGLQRGAGGDLSLPIAKSFVELNGGRFSVKPRADGGHTYRFALPRAQTTKITDETGSSH